VQRKSHFDQGHNESVFVLCTFVISFW